MANNSQHWSSIKEAGTYNGMRFLYLLYKIFGRYIFSLAMYPIALYFVFFRHDQRKASHHFLLTHYKYSPKKWRFQPNHFHTLLHFKSFSDVILDKVLGWLIDINEDEFILTDPRCVEQLLNDKRGQLIIGSHFGNLEFCRGFMQRYKDKTINVLLYDKHAGNFVKIMQKKNPDSRLQIFQVDEFDVTTIMTLKEKIDSGEWVFIAGDRIPLTGLERSVYANFLGEPAPFPVGPYMLAKAMNCPVTFMFAYRMKSKNNKVVFDVTPVCEKLTISRKNRMEDIKHYAQLFADKLTEHSIQAPYQWFNFYDFWNPEKSTSKSISQQP
ncbi:LpxL/LpxP family acyltransferase [Eionea flava]